MYGITRTVYNNTDSTRYTVELGAYVWVCVCVPVTWMDSVYFCILYTHTQIYSERQTIKSRCRYLLLKWCVCVCKLAHLVQKSEEEVVQQTHKQNQRTTQKITEPCTSTWHTNTYTQWREREREWKKCEVEQIPTPPSSEILQYYAQIQLATSILVVVKIHFSFIQSSRDIHLSDFTAMRRQKRRNSGPSVIIIVRHLWLTNHLIAN